MSKISSRDIRLLVAGALALAGFQALISVQYYLAEPMNWRRITGSLFAGLALPIGIGIFLGKASAILWARVYLWLVLITGGIATAATWDLSPERGGLALSLAPEMLVAIVLLGLIFWSSSERFRHEPDA